VEGRDNSTIIVVEGSWQTKKEIVQHLLANRFNPTVKIQWHSILLRQIDIISSKCN
jgi:hypothetical protein